VTATASGNFEYYSFSVASGATVTFDIDQASNFTLDTYLKLLGADGFTVLIKQRRCHARSGKRQRT